MRNKKGQFIKGHPVLKKWKEKYSNSMKGKKLTEEHKRKIGLSLKGHLTSKETRKKIGKAHRGMKFTEESKKKMSESHKGIQAGKNNPNWKGGVSSKRDEIRGSIEFRLWRESVFARDNWTCQKYGIRGGEMCAHHIKNFAKYPELRFAIDNGITFSEKAHEEFHKKYGKKNNTIKQLKEFLEE